MARVTTVSKTNSKRVVKKISTSSYSKKVLVQDKRLISKIDIMIKQFEDQEKYEKCAKLLEQKNKIINKWSKRKVKI